MNKTDLNYIKRRLNLLGDTAKELKQEFKKTKTPLLQELYLEIECYSREIKQRLDKAERRLKNNGKN